jgi:FKBP-type peptidyl-prolyl cis-trans isomerase
MFDSTVARGQPTSFGLDARDPRLDRGPAAHGQGREVPCLWIPEELAYKGRPGSPAGMLVFDVELLSFSGPDRARSRPPKTSPRRRQRRQEDRQLASPIRCSSRAPAPPSPTDDRARVEVHYSGWTTDGKMFDSSASPAAAPASFALKRRDQAGWTEGLQLMVARGDRPASGSRSSWPTTTSPGKARRHARLRRRAHQDQVVRRVAGRVGPLHRARPLRRRARRVGRRPAARGQRAGCGPRRRG